MRQLSTRAMLATSVLALMTGNIGCSSGSSAVVSSSSAISVSGTLSLSNSSQGMEKIHRMQSINGDSDLDAFAVSDYSVVCATATAPIVSATGVVATDGTFSVSIDANGKQMKCYLTDSAGDNKGDFLVENTSNKDLNGNSEMSSEITPKSNVAMGPVEFDPNAGEVIVPSTAISSAITTAVTGTVFDPTGSWTISAVDFTLPNGVRSSCTQAERDADTCHGPPDGQAIYLKMWNGVKTADSSAIYGLQVWNSESAYTSCGSKIGLPTDAKAQIGVDFSAHGSADAEFSFATSATFNDNILSASSTAILTDNWKMDTAKTTRDIHTGCGAKTVTVGSTTYSNVYVCGPDVANGNTYQLNVGGGCVVTSTGAAVQVNNWSSVTSPSHTSTTDANGIVTNTMTGTYNSQAITCTSKFAVGTLSDSVFTVTAGSFDYSHLTKIAMNDFCKDIVDNTDALRLAKLQCYAEYFWQSGLSESNSHCLPRVDTDWSTSDPAHFLKKDFRPNQMVFFDQYKPVPSGDGGSMLTRQEHYQGVQLDGNSWVNCNVIETGGLSFKKISDTKLLATYVSSEVTTSTAKPACMAHYTGAKKTFIFYMNK